MKKIDSRLRDCVAEIIHGFDHLPVLVRLQFVADVLCEKAGDSRDPESDPTLRLLVEVLDNSMRVLKTVPGIEKLSWAKPRP
jgi:hypothetical protein